MRGQCEIRMDEVKVARDRVSTSVLHRLAGILLRIAVTKSKRSREEGECEYAV
jgi:hypothetical protein